MAREQRQLNTGWDALIRAAARTGHAAALRLTSTGGLKGDGHGRRDLHTMVGQGITLARIIFTAPVAEDEHGDTLYPHIRAADMLDYPLHEDAQGLLEAAAIAWRELRDADTTDSLEPFIPVPNADPVIAMRISPARMAEFEAAGPTMPPLDDYERRIWYLEIDQPKAGQPRSLIRWRTRGDSGVAGPVRVCGIWTSGPGASFDKPFVLSMSWELLGDEAKAGWRRWPLFDGKPMSNEQRPGAARGNERVKAMQEHYVPVIMQQAIAAWVLAESMGRAPARSTLRRDDRRRFTTPSASDPDRRYRDQRQLADQLLQTSFLALPSCPQGSEGRSLTLPTPPTALDAVLMAGARAADRAGFVPAGQAGEPPLWSEDWWARAEQGVVMWHMTTSQREDGELVGGRYRFVNAPMEDIIQRPAPVAIKCASQFIMQILAQTQRAQVFHSRMPGVIHGIKIPPRLWRALGEAGPHPEPPDPFAEERWWYAEIEEPEPDEPRGVAIWLHGNADRTHAESGIAIWTEGPHATPEKPVVVGWRLPSEEPAARIGFGWARLDAVPHAHGAPGPSLPDDVTEHYWRLADIALKGSGSIRMKVHAAISEHLTRGTVEPLTLGTPTFEVNARTGPATASGKDSANGRTPGVPESIFQLIRAPDPIVSDPRQRARTPAGGRGHELTERHYVKAHYKRQAYGPGQSLRQVICVEGYWRGPEPDAEHVPLERLADRPPRE